MANIFELYEESERYLQEFLDAPKKAQQLMLLPLINEWFYPTIMCENIVSPIEQIFITAFDLYLLINNKENISLFSQAPITVGEKRYVADFLFERDEFVNKFNIDRKIIIECDGHQFHQKTKEQVQYDNEREYDLKMAGYEILRFSGSQIYNKPLKCAEDTYNYIFKGTEEDNKKWQGKE